MSHYTPTSPVVSALMVTHDAEKTVRRAVESLQNQTLRNFELVVVDAGSQDSTLRLLESAAERDMRIRVVQADACDRQTALNLALDRARGTYLTVTDADGWADQTMFADLVDAAERGRAELVIGGFVLSIGLSGGREARAEVSSEGVAYPTQHEFRAAAWKLLSSGQLLPAGGKLFSRAFAERCGVRFLPSSGSDHSFVTGFLADVERVVVCPGTCCHMVRRAARQGADGALEAHRHVEGEHGAILELFRHWGLEGDVRVFTFGEDTGDGSLVLVYVDDAGIVYALADNSNAVIMDFPNDADEIVPQTSVSEFPVTWINENAADGQ